jgi:phosphoribosylformylglycinamidine synthase PurS subunit
MKYEVVVALKKEVLDTQGRTIRESLNHRGLSSLKDVQVSKRFVLEFDQNQENPDDAAKKIASEILANPVSETFDIRKL